MNNKPSYEELGKRIKELEIKLNNQEKSIENEYALYKEIYDNTNDAVALIDENAYYIKQNKAHKELTEYSDNEIIGKSPAIFLGDNAFKIIKERLSKNKIYSAKHLIKTKSGQNCYDITVFSFPYKSINNNKDNEKIIGEIRIREIDQTQLNKKKLFTHGNVMIFNWINENNWPIEYASPNVKTILGYTSDEMKQDNFIYSSLIHPNDFDRVKQEVSKFSETKEENFSHKPYRLISKSGKVIWVLDYTITVKDNNQNITNYLGYLVDISDRMQAENEVLIAKEKAEQSNKLKTEFLQNMSHEIRTPMNGIMGFARIMNNETLSNDKIKNYTNIIINSSEQLLKIIDDILEISKLETKQIKAEKNAVCLNCLLTNIFIVFDIKAKENKTPLYLKKSLSDEESKIYTDEIKLFKIISNILENSFKFTSKGFIELGYTIVNNSINIYVADTGIGIDNNKQDKIFERFSQEEEELSKKYGGLGLGLSIAKENAELLGGNITFESQKGEGTTFNITIPYSPVIKKVQKVYSDKEKSIDNKTYFNMLIVEDEEINFFYLETLLEDFEYKLNIIHAKDGLEAVKICENNSLIDLILMDIKTPYLNGYEATKKIKILRPELPVIAQTAYSTPEDEKKALNAGCNDFISKPISKEILFDKIRPLLNISKYMPEA